MRFELLGPVQVVDDRGATAVSAPRLRVLLTALLLYANQPVRTGELAELVWDGNPPPGAASSVRAYVMRLRKVLGSEAGARILTREPGYLIEVAEPELDTLEFEALCARASAATADHHWAEASEAAGRALALWRSTPLSDVPGQELRDRWLPRLDRQRVQALEWRVEADLHLGRHARLMPELRELCREHPLREGFHAQLMLALARCGQRGDALAVYQQVRRDLVAELGIEPGAELRAAQQEVLSGDIDADPQPVAGPVPRQLPAPVPHFVGRDRELQALTERLDGGGTVVVSAISGGAGIGKTALALHWAHRVAGRFPDGQLYVNLRGFDPDGRAMAPAAAVRGFLDALGVPAERVPAELDARAALFRSLLADRRMLILLDNARDADQVRPLLPGTAAALAVVTSRNELAPLVADGAHPVPLNLLTGAESRQLLARRIDHGRVAATPEAVGEIVDACARLPLALALVAARAATHPTFPLTALAAELAQARSGTNDVLTQVRAVFSWSYATLSPAAAGLFRLLGLHPGPDFSRPAAAALAGCDTRRLLAGLTQAGLLTEHTAGRYRFHDLLRAYAADLAHTTDPDGTRQAATARLLDHYAYGAHAADRRLNPARKPIPLPLPPVDTADEPADAAAALVWLSDEHPVLLASQRLAARTGFDTRAWQLAWALDTFLDRRGHWSELTEAWQTALAAADRLGDPAATAQASRLLAHASTRLDSYDQAHAHLRRALQLDTAAGDLVGQADSHFDLGILWGMQDRPDRALGHAQQALALYRATDHRHGQAYALNKVGWCLGRLGQHTLALAHGEQALALHQRAGDRNGEAPTWDNLGYAHQELGHHARAVDCYRRAATLYRDLGDRYEEAVSLRHLGETQLAAGRPDAARTAWSAALDILVDLDHPGADAVRAQLCAG